MASTTGLLFKLTWIMVLTSTCLSCLVTFNYTGAIQQFVVPNSVSSLDVTACGGQGSTWDPVGSRGGLMEATISVTPGETLYIYVGGQGSNNKPFNGGSSFVDGAFQIAYGGDATDIRRTASNLNSRLVVAGGGGAGANINAWGGTGGGTTGGSGEYGGNGYYSQFCGSGGSANAGGSASSSWGSCTSGTFGVGGGGNTGCYGGGGGWYGGGGGASSGGGGSGFSSGTILRSVNGACVGNGYLVVKFVGVTCAPSSLPTSVPTSPSPVPTTTPTFAPTSCTTFTSMTAVVGVSTNAITLIAGNTNIQIGMTVTGTGIPAGTTVTVLVSTTVVVLSTTVTLAAYSLVAFTYCVPTSAPSPRPSPLPTAAPSYLLSNCGTIISVNSFVDSASGSCSIGSTTCTLRACVAALQGLTGTCLLAAGTHFITRGAIGASSTNMLNAGTQLTIMGAPAVNASAHDTSSYIIDGSGTSNANLLYMNDASTTLFILGVTITKFVFTVASGGNCVNVGRGGAIYLSKGKLYIRNSILSYNQNAACGAIFAELSNAVNADTRVAIVNTTFSNNVAASTDGCNSGCNGIGSVCFFSNLGFAAAGSGAEYSLEGVTFTDNVANGAGGSCSAAEGLNVHLGNFQGGNCYAANGEMCYPNQAKMDYTCITYRCKQAGYSFISPFGNACAPTTVSPTGQPSRQPSRQPTSQPTQPTGQPTGYPSGNPTTKPSAFTNPTPGCVWTQQVSSGSRSWGALVSSADGSKLAAGASSGYIYTSSDSGSTWTARTNSGSRNWVSIASSSDGMKLAAAASNDFIYTSTNAGVTWSASAASGSRKWYQVASSLDGVKLAATDSGTSTGSYIYTSVDSGGYIYTSVDSGISWTARTGAGVHEWYGIASNWDGTRLAAGTNGVGIYISSDSGLTWRATIPVDGYPYLWKFIASSYDGSILVTCFSNEVFISRDYGRNWTTTIGMGKLFTSSGYQLPGLAMASPAMSSNGNLIVQAIDSPYWYSEAPGRTITVSSDSGATWTLQDETLGFFQRSWNVAAASSARGTKLVVAADYIYTAKCTYPASLTSRGLYLQFDAATYSGSGNWVDTVTGVQFVPYNGVTYSSTVGGGSFAFNPSLGQYMQSRAISSLPTWSIEIWHLNTGIFNGSQPSLLADLSSVSIGMYTLTLVNAYFYPFTTFYGEPLTITSCGCPASSTIAAVTSSSLILKVVSTTGLSAGNFIFGNGISAGTTVSSLSANSLTLSQPVSNLPAGTALTFASNSVTRSGTVSAGTSITLSSSATIPVGATVSGTGIAANATVATFIDSTHVTISQPASSTGAAVMLTFSWCASACPYGQSTAIFTTTTTTVYSRTLIVVSAKGIVIGATISAYGINTIITVSAVTGNTLKLSWEVGLATGTALAFTVTATTISSAALGSMSILVTSTVRLTAGCYVTGIGIAANTTIATVTALNSNTLTLSQSVAISAGTALTFSISTTATYAASSSTIVVTSSAGFVVGCVLTGVDIPASTTISSISGTAITLSQGVTRPSISSIVTCAFTAIASADPTSLSKVSVTSTLSIAVGLTVTGTGVPASTVVTATSPNTAITLSTSLAVTLRADIPLTITLAATASTVLASKEISIDYSVMANVAVNSTVSGPHIPIGTTVTAIFNTITLSNTVILPTGTILTFTSCSKSGESSNSVCPAGQIKNVATVNMAYVPGLRDFINPRPGVPYQMAVTSIVGIPVGAVIYNSRYNFGTLFGMTVLGVYSSADSNFVLGSAATGSASHSLSIGYESNPTGLTWNTSAATPLPSSGVFHHTVATFNGTYASIYIDSVLKVTTRIAGTSVSGNVGIRLMRSWAADGGYWGGSLGFLRMYSVALTQAEVNVNWLAKKDRFASTTPAPTGQPTRQPSLQPTVQPTTEPSKPSPSPTPAPTVFGYATTSTTIGTSANPAFDSPKGVCVDSLGSVYVTDYGLGLVRRIAASDGAVASLGTSASPAFSHPWGVAVDTRSNVFVSDYTLGLVRLIDGTTGLVTSLGTSASPAFKYPAGVAVDQWGSVYVADSGNSLVRMIAASGSGGAVSSLGTSASPAFSRPLGVAVDLAGNVYISDTGNSLVRMIAVSSGLVSTLGTSASLAFSSPYSVAVDAGGDLLVADTGNSLVRRIAAATGLVTSIGKATSPAYNRPSGVAVDASNAVYVADYGNGLVRKIVAKATADPTSFPSSRPTGQPSRFPTSKPTGQPSEQPTSQPSRQPTMQPSGQPTGQPSAKPSGQPSMQPSCQPSCQPSLQPSSQPTVQPTEQPSIQPSVQPSDQPSRQPTMQPTMQPSMQPTAQPSVQPTMQPSGQPSTQPTAQPSSQPFASPSSQPTTTPSKPTFTPTPAPTVFGYSATAVSLGVSASSPVFDRPACVAIDSSGNLLVTDSGLGLVKKITIATGAVTNFGTSASPPFNKPYGIAIDSLSRVYVADYGSNLIRVISSGSGNNVTTIGTSASPGFSYPAGVAVDRYFSVYVADSGNSLLRKISTDGSVTSLFTSGASPPFSNPFGVACDAYGMLYLADTGNSLIRKMSAYGTGNVTTLTTTTSSGPKGIAVDAAGGVFFSDTANNLVRKIAVATDVITSLGTGSSPGFLRPLGLAVDGAGNVAICDSANSLVRQISTTNTASPTPRPTPIPTIIPSASPTFNNPTARPSPAPTAPTRAPTRVPTLFGYSDSSSPTGQPSKCPSAQPTSRPSSPTGQPTRQPTRQPSSQPSHQPNSRPTSNPTQPTGQPSRKPTGQPSRKPTGQPTRQPTCRPSRRPSSQPTMQPTGQPSRQPSARPTRQPTMRPSAQPSRQPSSQPSNRPSRRPTSQPTRRPSRQPTAQPSRQPSGRPSGQPSAQPTSHPSAQPSGQPSSQLQVFVSFQTVHELRSTTLTAAVFASNEGAKRAYLTSLAASINANANYNSGNDNGKRSNLQPNNIAIDNIVDLAQRRHLQLHQYTSNEHRQATATAGVTVTVTISVLPQKSLIGISGSNAQDPYLIFKAAIQNTSSLHGFLQASGVPVLATITSTPAVSVSAPLVSYLHSSEPTPSPTASPTRGYCTPGQYASNDKCLPCAPGTYCPQTGYAATFKPCLAGTFSTGGQAECALCPANTYGPNLNAVSLQECYACPSGRLSLPGSSVFGACNSPTVSYITGCLALVLSAALAYEYIWKGRFFGLASGRQELKDELVRRCNELAKVLRVQLNTNYVKSKAISVVHRSVLRLIVFVVGAIIILAVVVGLGVLWTIQGTFYSVYILVRSQISFSGLASLQDAFVEALDVWISIVAQIYNFVQLRQVVIILAIPIAIVIRWLDTIHLSEMASTLNVTCSGSTAPLFILTNLLIFSLIVFLIQSQFLLIGRARQKLCYFFLERFGSSDFIARTNSSLLKLTSHLGYIGVMSRVNTTVVYKGLLRFAMTLPVISPFFLSGYHPWTDVCSDSADPQGLDKYLAIASTVIAYLLIYPTIYTLSLVCTPQGKPGTLKSTLLRSCFGGCLDIFISITEFIPLKPGGDDVEKRIKHLITAIKQVSLKGMNRSNVGLNLSNFKVNGLREKKKLDKVVYTLCLSPNQIGVNDPIEALRLVRIAMSKITDPTLNRQASMPNLNGKENSMMNLTGAKYEVNPIPRPTRASLSRNRNTGPTWLGTMQRRVLSLFSLDLWIAQLDNTFILQIESYCREDVKFRHESIALLDRIKYLLTWRAWVPTFLVALIEESCKMRNQMGAVPSSNSSSTRSDFFRPIRALGRLLSALGRLLLRSLFFFSPFGTCFATLTMDLPKRSDLTPIEPSEKEKRWLSWLPSIMRDLPKPDSTKVASVFSEWEIIDVQMGGASRRHDDKLAADDLPSYRSACADCCNALGLSIGRDWRQFTAAYRALGLEEGVDLARKLKLMYSWTIAIPLMGLVFFMGLVYRCVMILLVILGPGQLLSRCGRQYLLLVVDKFLTLLEVTLGFWSDEKARCYDLHGAIQDCDMNSGLNNILEDFLRKTAAEVDRANNHASDEVMSTVVQEIKERLLLPMRRKVKLTTTEPITTTDQVQRTLEEFQDDHKEIKDFLGDQFRRTDYVLDDLVALVHRFQALLKRCEIIDLGEGIDTTKTRSSRTHRRMSIEDSKMIYMRVSHRQHEKEHKKSESTPASSSKSGRVHSASDSPDMPDVPESHDAVTVKFDRKFWSNLFKEERDTYKKKREEWKRQYDRTDDGTREVDMKKLQKLNAEELAETWRAKEALRCQQTVREYVMKKLEGRDDEEFITAETNALRAQLRNSNVVNGSHLSTDIIDFADELCIEVRKSVLAAFDLHGIQRHSSVYPRSVSLFQDIEGLIEFADSYRKLLSMEEFHERQHEHEEHKDSQQRQDEGGEKKTSTTSPTHNLDVLEGFVATCVFDGFVSEKSVSLMQDSLELATADAEATTQEIGETLYFLLHAIRVPVLNSDDYKKRDLDKISDYSELVSALISTRAVLFQVVPALTAVSIYASYMASSPFSFVNITDQHGKLFSAMPFLFSHGDGESRSGAESDKAAAGAAVGETEHHTTELDNPLESRPRRFNSFVRMASDVSGDRLKNAGKNSLIVTLFGWQTFKMFTSSVDAIAYEPPQFLLSMQKFANTLMLSRLFKLLYNGTLFSSTMVMYANLGIADAAAAAFQIPIVIIIAAAVVFWLIIGIYAVVAWGEQLQLEQDDFHVVKSSFAAVGLYLFRFVCGVAVSTNRSIYKIIVSCLFLRCGRSADNKVHPDRDEHAEEILEKFDNGLVDVESPGPELRRQNSRMEREAFKNSRDEATIAASSDADKDSSIVVIVQPDLMCPKIVDTETNTLTADSDEDEPGAIQQIEPSMLEAEVPKQMQEVVIVPPEVSSALHDMLSKLELWAAVEREAYDRAEGKSIAIRVAVADIIAEGVVHSTVKLLVDESEILKRRLQRARVEIVAEVAEAEKIDQERRIRQERQQRAKEAAEVERARKAAIALAADKTRRAHEAAEVAAAAAIVQAARDVEEEKERKRAAHAANRAFPDLPLDVEMRILGRLEGLTEAQTKAGISPKIQETIQETIRAQINAKIAATKKQRDEGEGQRRQIIAAALHTKRWAYEERERDLHDQEDRTVTIDDFLVPGVSSEGDILSATHADVQLPDTLAPQDINLDNTRPNTSPTLLSSSGWRSVIHTQEEGGIDSRLNRFMNTFGSLDGHSLSIDRDALLRRGGTPLAPAPPTPTAWGGAAEDKEAKQDDDDLAGEDDDESDEQDRRYHLQKSRTQPMWSKDTFGM